MGKTKVLIVDDSALVRRLLTEIISSDSELEVVGAAVDPYDAREKIKQLNPDVLTLDVEMPKMDGITFLRNLMRLRPMPVVMVSSLTEKGAEVTLEALELGAFDFVTKPKVGIQEGLLEYADELTAKLKAAVRAGVRARALPQQVPPINKVATNFRTTDRVIAIASSTGGTEAVTAVLRALPPDLPGIVIAQHILPLFSSRFAARMDQVCQIRVKEAQDGEQILMGHAYLAPGDRHLRVRRSGAHYYCRISDEPPVNRHRPSCDVLFDSVASDVRANAIGLILTGMGADGAEGLLKLLKAGGRTIAQDEASSVVWGMPGSAVKLGAAQEVLPLPSIAQRLIQLSR